MRSKGLLICTGVLFVAGLTLAACSRSEGDGEDGFEGPTAPSSVQPSPAPTPAPGPAPTPTPAPTGAVAYNPDIKPIFDADCIRCHGGSSPSAGYSMTTYAGVMALVRPGDPNSILLQVTRTGGLMYSQFSGDRAAKSDLVRRWVVDNNAAQNR